MTPDITFIGWHNSGKTTVLRAVVKELCRRGLRVGVTKSTKHTGIDLDSKRADTSLLMEAGAVSAELVTPDGPIFLCKDRQKIKKGTGNSSRGEVDIVLGEGFKHDASIPKIEVARKDLQMEGLLKDRLAGVVAIITDMDVTGVRVFRFSQTEQLCDFIQDLLKKDKTKCDNCVT